jgi:hypothetical protein
MYSSPNVIRIMNSTVMSWMRHIAHTRKKKRILMGKPEGKRPFGRPRYRWLHNIKINIKETGWGGMGWTNVDQDTDQWRTLVNTVMNLQVLGNSWVTEELIVSQEGLRSMELVFNEHFKAEK